MPSSENVKFVARQAILDRNENVFAYELLYRNSMKNYFPADVSDDVATARLFFDSLLFFGINKLSDNKKVFINLSANSFIYGLPELISPRNVVLEIIERTDKLDQVQRCVEALKKLRYNFALDDYDGDQKWDNLLQQVKYIKIEVDKDIEHTLKRIAQLKAKYPNKYIIVERIEDDQTFQLIRGAGADFFQGYYFTKPKLLHFKNINPSKLATLDLLNITLQRPINFASLTHKVEKDIALVSSLLRLSNLRCKSSNKKISSISQAVIYLGEDVIKQFVTVLCLGDLGDDKPSELIKIGLIRAKFIELLLQSNKKLSESGYLLGIVSILNVLIDADFESLFDELSLSLELKDALTNKSSELGRCLDLCFKIENADFTDITEGNKFLNLDENFIMHCYSNALVFADEIII
ncbi:EAL and HDOD domain-containing protein [Psychromonas sp. KJ10-10]|uniref:EAL and HDOD domain-containing protein n=1 Tax=Psychromonas sp. KJ10-10 TaxID=3391823 RepID=UPI0039B41133